MPNCEIEPEKQVVRNLFLLKPIRFIKTKTKKQKLKGCVCGGGGGSGETENGAGLACGPWCGSGRHFKEPLKGERSAPYMAAVFTRPQPITPAVPSHVTCHEGTHSHFLVAEKLATSAECFTLLCMPNAPAECV